MRFWQNRRTAISNRRGMTLIEIMIVLAIIGSIMALLLPKLVGSQDKAKVKEAKIQLGQLMNSISMYYTDCGKYPTSLAGLSKPDPACSNWGPDPYYKLSKGHETIQDPWGHDFVYEATGGSFTLKSLGRDGAEGGSGYDADISSDDL